MLVTICLLFTSILCLQSEGQIDSSFVEQHYAFSDFDSLIVKGAFRIRVHKSDQWDIHVFSSREDRHNVKFRKRNNVFEISLKGETPHHGLSPVIIISMPNLYSLDLSGLVQMEAGGFTSENDLEVNLGQGCFLNLNGFEMENASFQMSGPSELHAFISAESIHMNNSGRTTVRMGGRAINFHFHTDGQSKIDGTLLLVDNVNLNLIGENEIRITPDVSLTVQSRDRSLIYYSDKYMDSEPEVQGNAILRKY